MEIKFDPFRSIYPLFIWDRKQKSSAGSFSFCGTGFFALFDAIPMIVTARHVLNRLTSEEGLRLVISEKYGVIGNPITICGGVLWKETEDFGAFMPLKHTYDRFIRQPIALPFHSEQISPWEDVYAFGYPFNVVETSNGSDTKPAGPVAVLSHVFLKGYLVTDCYGEYIVGNDSFDLNYQVSFPGYPGFSGAPLLTMKTGRPEVAGIIYKNHKVEMDDIEANFALCSTHRTLKKLEGHIMNGRAKGKIH